MTVDVKVPVLAESIPDATLLEWRKQPGDTVDKDEILIELETDKVVLEIPAPEAGVLTEVLKQNGDTVLSQEVLARIDSAGSAAATSLSLVPEPVPAPVASAAAASHERLSPAVRRLVDEHALDSSRIPGTGRDGRITKADVLAHVEASAKPAATATASPPAPAESARASAPAAPAPALVPAGAESVPGAPAPGRRDERREPMSRLRRRIAERLVEAQHTAAILTTFNEINMQPVIALRRRHKDGFESRHGVCRSSPRRRCRRSSVFRL